MGEIPLDNLMKNNYDVLRNLLGRGAEHRDGNHRPGILTICFRSTFVFTERKPSAKGLRRIKG